MFKFVRFLDSFLHYFFLTIIQIGRRWGGVSERTESGSLPNIHKDIGVREACGESIKRHKGVKKKTKGRKMQSGGKERIERREMENKHVYCLPVSLTSLTVSHSITLSSSRCEASSMSSTDRPTDCADVCPSRRRRGCRTRFSASLNTHLTLYSAFIASGRLLLLHLSLRQRPFYFLLSSPSPSSRLLCMWAIRFARSHYSGPSGQPAASSINRGEEGKRRRRLVWFPLGLEAM